MLKEIHPKQTRNCHLEGHSCLLWDMSLKGKILHLFHFCVSLHEKKEERNTNAFLNKNVHINLPFNAARLKYHHGIHDPSQEV